MTKKKKTSNKYRIRSELAASNAVPCFPREHYTVDKQEKFCYKSESSARRFIETRIKRGEVAEGELDAYECRYCGCWHIGHKRLLPTEKYTLLQSQRHENYTLMLRRYRDDLDHIANQVLAVLTKIENLEYLIKNGI